MSKKANRKVTKKVIRELIDNSQAGHPFELKGQYVCLSVNYTRGSNPKQIYSVRYGERGIYFAETKKELIDYLYDTANAIVVSNPNQVEVIVRYPNDTTKNVVISQFDIPKEDRDVFLSALTANAESAAECYSELKG